MTSLTISGMAVRLFQGHEGIYEVECSSSVLDSNTNLRDIVLYSVANNEALASLDVKSKQCFTRVGYVSCLFDRFWSSRTVLRALVVDLQFGESRLFGCNLTSSPSGSVINTVSWRIVVIRPRELICHCDFVYVCTSAHRFVCV